MSVQQADHWTQNTLVEDKLSFPALAEQGDMVLHVHHPSHWQVLRSVYRMRIFEAIRSAAGCSIRDLAGALGSSTTALYYHLDLLVAAGLIKPTTGTELLRGGRKPTLFVACAERLIVEFDPTSTRDLRRIAAINKTWLEESQVDTQLYPVARNDAAAAATVAWEALTPEEAREIRGYLRRVEALMAQARARRDRNPGNTRCASHHVLFTVAPTRRQILPNPMLVFRPVDSTREFKPSLLMEDVAPPGGLTD